MTAKTVLNEAHRALGARMVDFGGWDMPINYGSQIEEHHAVRKDAGMFDVSHMTVVDLHGERVRDFLRHLLANSVDKLTEHGKALYTCMLNERGGVIDDLIVYYLGESFFRIVVNAATREKDLAWIGRQAEAFEVEVRERAGLRHDRGAGSEGAREADRPAGRGRSRAHPCHGQVPRRRGPGAARRAAVRGAHRLHRRGRLRGHGRPPIMPSELWQALLDAGVRPAGLGARDTLRLEAGMNLYGQDMDEDVTPWEAGLGWTVAMDEGRDFIGREALEAQKDRGREAAHGRPGAGREGRACATARPC